MNSLYRIKPLVWSPGRGMWTAGEWAVLEREDCFEARGRHLAKWISDEETLEDAKVACENHRRQQLEPELEPAHQPTTELPTEPGLYWWRRDNDSPWFAMEITEERPGKLVSTGPAWNGAIIHKNYIQGQWIRIPEPEVGHE